MTYDDAQSGRDHLDPHRTPMIVISPYAKPGFLATRHYSTASIVKTEELLLGLPPNNYGDLFATDLRDMFQSTYNGIHLGPDGLTLLGPNQQALVKAPQQEHICGDGGGPQGLEAVPEAGLVLPGPGQLPPEPRDPALHAGRHAVPSGREEAHIAHGRLTSRHSPASTKQRFKSSTAPKSATSDKDGG